MAKVSIADLTIDLKIQLRRRGIDESTVRGYIDALTNGATFPPIVVFQDGDSMLLADGFHRVSAYRFCGIGEVEADVRPGGRNDALIYAAVANAESGRPMSREEKREAGERLLKMTNQSDYEIAKALAVTRQTVTNWRDSLSSKLLLDKNNPRTVTRNGTTYQMNTTNIGNNGHKPAQQPALIGQSSGPSLQEKITQARYQKYLNGSKETNTEPESPPVLPDSIQLIHGDLARATSQIEPGSIDAIITDPPYPKEYLYLYEILAQQAARLLKPGGSLLAMCGQSYLPEILKLMCPHLAYHWIDAYLTPGGQSPQIWPRKINTFWKPVLWFTNGDYTGPWQGDVIKSAVNDNDKRFHHWGQSESGIADIVNRYSKPGDLILDPFLGGGTTAVVCRDLERRFIGIDIDPAAIRTTRQRLLDGSTT